MIGIIDYGVGNLFSLCSSLKKTGAEFTVSGNEKTLGYCDRLILPGVGAFGAAMDKLNGYGLVGFIRDYAKNGGSVLGICLGMQLLFERSYEFGAFDGLGLIEGEIRSLKSALAEKGLKAKVPQMGWNEFKTIKKHALTDCVDKGDFVYYVHSFYAPVGDYTAAYSEYGVDVTGIAACGNVAGCQFHPEKSGDVGLKILSAFAKGDDRI